MARIKAEDVRDVINVKDGVSLIPFIADASALTAWLVTQDMDGVLTESLLTRIEAYLAAHFYACKDPQYQQEMTGRSGGMKMGQNTMVFMATPWGQSACGLDITGALALRSQSAMTGVTGRTRGRWLGKDCG